MSRRGLSVGTLLLACATPLVQAQTDDDDIPKKDTTAAVAAVGFVAPPSVSEASIAAPAVDLVAERDAKQATVRFGISAGDEQIALVLRSPLSDSGDSDLLTDTGLPNHGSLGLTYNRILWSFDPDPDKTTAACQILAHTPNCKKGSLSSADQERFKKLVGYSGAPWVVTIAGSVGRNTFTWSDAATLSPNKSRHDDWEAQFGLGTIRPFGYIGVSYRHRSAFSGAPTKQVCQSATAPGATTCATLALAAPTESKTSLVAAEVRHYFGERAAINPRIARDFEAKIWRIELPVYAFTEAKKGLTGGGAVSWRSDTKDLSVRVFVGALFTVVPLGQ
jgi:hypothetical protein